MFNWNERLKIVAERVTLDLHVQQKKNLSAHIHTYNHKPVNIQNVKKCYQLLLKYYPFNVDFTNVTTCLEMPT